MDILCEKFNLPTPQVIKHQSICKKKMNTAEILNVNPKRTAFVSEVGVK